MIKCISHDRGILFIKPNGKIKAYKVADLCPSGDENDLMNTLNATIFKSNPGFKEAFDEREHINIFCSVDGHWEWDMLDGRVVCGECGEPPLDEFEFLLVPATVLNAMREILNARGEDAEPPDPAAVRRQPGEPGSEDDAPVRRREGVEVEDGEHRRPRRG